MHPCAKYAQSMAPGDRQRHSKARHWRCGQSREGRRGTEDNRRQPRCITMSDSKSTRGNHPHHQHQLNPGEPLFHYNLTSTTNQCPESKKCTGFVMPPKPSPNSCPDVTTLHVSGLFFLFPTRAGLCLCQLWSTPQIGGESCHAIHKRLQPNRTNPTEMGKKKASQRTNQWLRVQKRHP